jgi:hypothetical protein
MWWQALSNYMLANLYEVRRTLRNSRHSQREEHSTSMGLDREREELRRCNTSSIGPAVPPSEGSHSLHCPPMLAFGAQCELTM